MSVIGFEWLSKNSRSQVWPQMRDYQGEALGVTIRSR